MTKAAENQLLAPTPPVPEMPRIPPTGVPSPSYQAFSPDLPSTSGSSLGLEGYPAGYNPGYPPAQLISLGDIVQSRPPGSVSASQGSSFQMRPALGGVPVVPPGAYEPFSMFWYLPLNPQIPIDVLRKHQQKLGKHLYSFVARS